MDLGDIVKGLAEQILEYQGKVALAHGAKGTKQKKVTKGTNQQKGTQQRNGQKKNGLVFEVKPKQVSAFDWMQQQMAKNAKELAEEYLQRQQSKQTNEKQQQAQPQAGQQQPKQQGKKQMTLEDVSRSVLGNRVSQANRERGLAVNQELSDEFSLKPAPTLEEVYEAVSNARINPQQRERMKGQSEVLEQKDKDYAAGMTYGAELVNERLANSAATSANLTEEDKLGIIAATEHFMPSYLPEGVVYKDAFAEGFKKALSDKHMEVTHEGLQNSTAVQAMYQGMNGEDTREWRNRYEQGRKDAAADYAYYEDLYPELEKPEIFGIMRAHHMPTDSAERRGYEAYIDKNAVVVQEFRGNVITGEDHYIRDAVQEMDLAPEVLEKLQDSDGVILAKYRGRSMWKRGLPDEVLDLLAEANVAERSYFYDKHRFLAELATAGNSFANDVSFGLYKRLESEEERALMEQMETAHAMGDNVGSYASLLLPGPGAVKVAGKAAQKLGKETLAKILIGNWKDLTWGKRFLSSLVYGGTGAASGTAQGVIEGDDWGTIREDMPENIIKSMLPLDILQKNEKAYAAVLPENSKDEQENAMIASLRKLLEPEPTMAAELPPEREQSIQARPVEQGLTNAAIDVANAQQKGWSAPVYMDSARKHLPKDNREAAKTFTIGKTLDLPVELSSQLPEGVDAITKNGKIYVSSTADDPAKGVFREYLARELHLPEGSSEILNPYLNDIPTIEKVWREAPELGIVIFQEIDGLRKQLKKQGSFFDDFLQPIQLLHYFYGQIEQEKRRYQKKA